MPRYRGIALFACIAASNFACSSDDWTKLDGPGIGSGAAALRDMTAVEASDDLEQVFNFVRTYYGPYEYKEARFNYSIAELEDKARTMLADSPSDSGFYTAAHWFLSRFDDGHTSIGDAPNANPVFSYLIGLFLQPVEGRALIAEILDPSLAELGIAYSDEVVAIDGVSPFKVLAEAARLQGLGNPVTNEHLIYTALIRPGFASSLRPTSPTAHLDFRRADGSVYSRDLIWRQQRTPPKVEFAGDEALMPAFRRASFLSQAALDMGRYAKGSLASIGSPTPFFYTEATAAQFDITPVTPNPNMLAKYGLDPSFIPSIFAGIYNYGGKTFLLIRQAGYSDSSGVELAYYRAVMDQYDSFVDGLVIDQTHNPGGYLSYCIDFARLITEVPGRNFVQAVNTDRTWINDFRYAALDFDPGLSSEGALSLELRASQIEAAYDAGKGVSDPIPFYYSTELPPDDQYVWTKPKLVLIDELAGSCGDLYPMLVKANHLAPLFGRRTMGLGGNVAEFPLGNSQAVVRLTRGLFTTYQADGSYAPGDFVENNGVLPDVEHIITVDDFRAGFVDYMTHFSEVIAAEVDAESAPPSAPPASEEPPASAPPLTDPPVNEPPANEPPVSDPPVSDPPVSEPPASDPPASESK